MRTIYKYPIDLSSAKGEYGSVYVEMHEGARILSVTSQAARSLVIYALVDIEEKRKERRNVVVVGTGRVATGTEKLKFLGTVQMSPYVWHVFTD